jgi:hypothetical protein
MGSAVANVVRPCPCGRGDIPTPRGCVSCRGAPAPLQVRATHLARAWRHSPEWSVFGSRCPGIKPVESVGGGRRTIQRLGGDGPGLYNSALVGLPMGDSPLDLVIDRVEQERWLVEGAETAYDLEERLQLPRGRPRSGAKYLKLASREDYQGIRTALLVYLMEVVPWPHETEGRFWSVTSLPSTKRTTRTTQHHRLCTISINNVETLLISEVLDEEGWFLGGFLNVAPGLASQRGWPMIRRNYRTVGDWTRLGSVDGRACSTF